jgi:folate/biopterin transporter
MFVSPSGLSQIKESVVEKLFFGHQPTPELIGILSVYIVQGILGLARLAISFFLKDDLALSPAQVAALMGIAALPWVVKPLFGLISDGLPIFGYRRRPYLILSGLLGTAAWTCLATVVHSPWTATLAIALSSLSVAVSDVIVDSLVVERVRGESASEAGSLQALCWGASALGGLVTAYFSGYLLEHLDTRSVFAIVAAFPLIVSGVAWLIAEEPAGENSEVPQVGRQLQQLWQAVKQKTIWMPAAFLFVWQSTPTAEAGFFYFTTNELGFGPEFLGRVRLVSSLAGLLGVWLFQRFLKTVPFRQIFGWSIVLSAALGMTTLLLVTHTNRLLGIDDRWFSLGDNLVLTVMGQIAFMPVLVLAARLCPPGIEATLFALLMSVLNLAGLVSHEMGALLTHWLGISEHNFDRLWVLVTIANLTTLLPLPLLGWLPNGDPQTESPSDTSHELPRDRHFPPIMEVQSSVAQHRNQPFVPEFFPELMPTVEETSTATRKSKVKSQKSKD